MKNTITIIKKSFLLLFAIIAFGNVHFANSTHAAEDSKAEASKELPKLTQKQMQEDIAFLIRSIKDIEPYISIREQVTGTPIMAEIDSLAATSKYLETFEDFYYLAQRILLLCQDQHENLQGYYPQGLEDSNYYISQEAIDISKLCYTEFDKYDPSGCLSNFKYVDGKYYSYVDIFINNDTSLIIPAGAQFLAINNIPIDEYVNTINRKIDNNIRWDNTRKKYYSYCIFSPLFTDLNSDTLVFTYSLDGIIKTINCKDLSMTTNFANGELDNKVLYFEQASVLYIRIPEMDYSKIDFYKKEILRYAKKPIKKVIIDIRDNGGGSDYVWMDILSSIIDKALITQSKIYHKNGALSKDYELNIRKNKIYSYQKDSLLFSISVDEPDTILPDKKSIRYSGKIYVLVDEKCFSSSLAFISYCERIGSEKLVTAGKNTGYIKGRSATPFFLTLPNSKLIFELTPCIDMSNVSKPADYYDNAAEIPIEPSIEYYINEVTYKGNRYEKEFLFNFDPIFKAALEAK